MVNQKLEVHSKKYKRIQKSKSTSVAVKYVNAQDPEVSTPQKQKQKNKKTKKKKLDNYDRKPMSSQGMLKTFF